MLHGRDDTAQEVAAGSRPTAIQPAPSNTEQAPDRAPRSNAATAASAASARALSAQLVAFYFRAPAKAFFRTRVDYLAFARTVYEAQAPQAPTFRDGIPRRTILFQRIWLWARSTTPGVLSSAIRHQGWAVVPHQILPPLVANIGVGAVLYTSYLHILGRLHEESAKANKRVYPPPPPVHTFAAGFLAGGLQSLLAAPLDALQARYDHRDLIGSGGGGRPRSMWTFGAEKLRDIGLRGIFAGWGLSLTKDSFGSAIFFSTFEFVKSQGYYEFVRWYYGGLGQDVVDRLALKRPTPQEGSTCGEATTTIRPYYAVEPLFLLLAGICASFSQQLLLHPLTHLQVKHWDHLEDLDDQAARYRARSTKDERRWRMLRAYYRAYRSTWASCVSEAAVEGQSVGRWLYRGFWWNAFRQVPSTSAGLVIFELIRRKYGFGTEEVRITKDGYDILLS